MAEKDLLNPKNTIDPRTGLTTYDSTNNTIRFTLPTSNDLTFGSQPSDFDSEKYNKYWNNTPIFTGEYVNIDEERAQRQSGGEQLRNGFVKMLGTAGTTAIDGFLGTAAGLVNLTQGENYSDNPVTRTMLDWQQKLEEVFPNYYTQAETESSNPFKGFLPGTEGSANFWGDKFMKNMGFTIGMALDGAIAGGLLNAALGTSRTAATIGKYIANAADEGGASLAEMTNLVKGLKAGTVDVSKFDKAIQLGAQAVRRKTIATQVGASVFASQAEARFEAVNQMDQTRKEQTYKLETELQSKQQQMLASGMDPREVESTIAQEKSERLSEIEDVVTSAGNAIFGLNMALLSATNFIQFKDAFSNSFNFGRKNLASSGNVADKTVASKIAGEFGKYSSKTGKLAKAGRITKGLINAATEGFEEGAQQSIQSGSDKYYSAKLNPNSKKEAVDLVDAFTYGISQGFRTKMGLEQVFIGALTGALGVPTAGGRRGVQWAGGVAADIRNELKSSKQAKTLAEQMNSAAAHITSQKAKEDALLRGDKYDYANADHQQFFNTVTTFAKAGKLNDLIEQLDGYSNVKGSDIRTMLITKDEKGNEVDPNINKSNLQLEQEAREKVEKLKNKALHVAQTRDDIKTLFPNVSDAVADEISYQASVINDIDDRISSITKDISQRFGISITPEQLKNPEEKKIIDEAIAKHIEEKPMVKENLTNMYKDLPKLLARRDKFVDSYKNLVTPEGQTKLERAIAKEEQKPVEEAKTNFRTDLHGKTVVDETGQHYVVVTDKKTGDTHLTPVSPYGEPMPKGKPITYTAAELSQDDFEQKYQPATIQERPKGFNLFGEDEETTEKPTEPVTEEPEVIKPKTQLKQSSRPYESHPKYRETEQKYNKGVLSSDIYYKIPLDTTIDQFNKIINDDDELEKYDTDIETIEDLNHIKQLTKKFGSNYTDVNRLGFNNDDDVNQYIKQLTKTEVALNHPSNDFYEEDIDVEFPDNLSDLIKNYHNGKYLGETKIAVESTFAKYGITEDILNYNPNQTSLNLESTESDTGDTIDTEVTENPHEFPDYTGKRTAQTLFSRLAGSQTIRYLKKLITFTSGRSKEVYGINQEPNSKRYFHWVTNTKIKNQGYKGKVLSGRELFGEDWNKEFERIVKDIIDTSDVSVKNKEAFETKVREAITNSLYVVMTKDGKYVTDSGEVDTLDYNTAIFTTLPAPDIKTIGGYTKVDESQPKEEVDKALANYKQQHEEIVQQKELGDVFVDITGKSQGMQNFGFKTKYIHTALDGHQVELRVNTEGNTTVFPNGVVHTFRNEDKKKGLVVIKDSETDTTYVGDKEPLTEQVKQILKDLLQLYANQKEVKPGKYMKSANNNLKNSSGNNVGLTLFQVFSFYLGDHMANDEGKNDHYWGLHSVKGEDDKNLPADFMWFRIGKIAQEVKVFDIDKKGNATFAEGFQEFFNDWLNKQHHSVKSSTLTNNEGVRVVTEVNLENNTVTVEDKFNKEGGYADYLVNPENPIVVLQINLETQEGIQQVPEYNDLLKLNQNLDFKYIRQEVTPIETTAPTEITDTLNRRATHTVQSEEDIEVARNWFEKRFPNVDFNIVKSLIDGRNWGQFRDAAIYIFENAETGTTYHEAWHVVTHLFLNRDEVQSLYDEYAKTNNLESKPWFTEGGRLTDEGRKIEEALADEFVDWKLGKPISSIKSRKQRSFFNKLWNTIKEFFGMKNADIETIFRRIDSGYYANKPKIYGIASKSNRVNEKLGLSNSQAHQLNRSMTSLVMAYIFDPKHPERVKSLFTNEDNRSVLEGAYEFAKYYITRKEKEYREAGNIPLADLQAHVLSVFDIARQGHKSHLLSELNLQITEDNEQVEQNENDKMQLRSESGIKRSVKESTTNNIKLLVSSLPACYIDENGKRQNELNDIGLPYTADFGMIFSILGNKLAGSDSMLMMDKRMQELEKNNPAITSLRNRLQIFNTLSISTDVAQSQMEFFQTFSRNYYDYWMDIMNPGSNNMFINATRNKLEQRTKEEWANNIGKIAKDNSKLYDDSVDDEAIRYNSKGFLEKYPVITEDNVFDFLRDLGVKFTNNGEILDYLMRKGEVGTLLNTAVQIRKKIIKAKEGSFPILFDNQIDTGMEGNVNYLLHLESSINTDFVENGHYDINDEQKYNLGLNSYETLLINSINNVETKEQLLAKCPFLNEEKCTYLKNSILLKLGGIIFNEDGSKKLRKIEFGFHEGSKAATVDPNTGTISKGEFVDLKYPDKLRVKLNNWFVTRGYFVLRPGDSDLERTAKFDGNDMVSNQSILDNTYNEQFFGYLTDELNRSVQYLHDGVRIKNRSNRALEGIFISLINDEIEGLENQAIKTALKNNLEGLLVNLNNTDTREEAQQLVDEFLQDTATRTSFNIVIDDFMDLETSRLIANCKANALITTSEDGELISNGLSLNESELTNEDSLRQALRKFVINDKAWVVEQTKLFTGDPIQFKSIEDQFKRHSSLVSTKRTVNDDWYIQMWMDKHMKRKDGKTHENSNYLGQHGTILSATFADPEGSARTLDELKKLLDKKAKSYAKYDKADAQGMITLDEYRWLLFKSGQWSFGKGSMEELYQYEIQKAQGVEEPVYRDFDGGGYVIKETPELKFKPQKLQYFGAVAEDGYTNIIFKLSVYPLTPSLVKGNKRLTELKNDLERQKIGVVTFESGNKIGYKVGENGIANDIYDRPSQLVTTNTYSKYWGVQVDSTPKPKNKVVSGTQMMKQILSNMASSGKFTNPILKRLRDEYVKVNDERIALGMNTLISKLGLVKDGANYIIQDLDKFKATLVKEAQNRNFPDNIVDGLQLMTANNGIDTLVNREKVENVLFALSDALVISQKRFGNSAVQASSVLIDEDLEFYKENVAETIPMEIKISTLFKEFPNLTVADIKKLPDGDKLLAVIGFRIPTQAMSSIDAATIKDFLPVTMNDMAVLPEEIVAKQGGDFDYDKFNQYFSNYYASVSAPVYINYGTEAEMKKGYDTYLKTKRKSAEERFEESVYGDIEDQNAMSFEEYKHKAIENRIKELQRSILLHPANAKTLLSPVDAQNLTSAAAYVTWIREGKKDLGKKTLDQWYKEYLDGKPLHNILNANFVDDIANRFQSGSSAIGIGALYATFVIACQQHGVVFENAVMNLEHNNSSNGVDISGNETTTKFNISDLFNEWLTIFVDAPKEPHMFNLGVNMSNVNVALYLTQAGVDPTTIGLFMPQPIIQAYLSAKEKNNSITYKENNLSVDTKTLLNNVVSSFNELHLNGKEITGSDYKEYTDYTLKQEVLENMILKEGNPKNPVQYCLTQSQVLSDFLKYESQANEISKAMQAINMDTSGGGKNISEMLYKLSLAEGMAFKDAFPPPPKTVGKGKKKRIVELPYIKGFSKIIGIKMNESVNVVPDETSDAFLAPYYKAVFDLKETFAPYVRVLRDPAIMSYINNWLNTLNSERVNKDKIIKVMDLIKQDLFSYLMITTPFEVNGVQFELDKERERLFYGDNTIADQLIAMKKTHKTNPVIKRLFPIKPKRTNYYGTKVKTADGINFYSSKTDKTEQDALVEGWQQLIDEGPFGWDLIKACLLQTGLKNSIVSFWNLIPAEVFNKMMSTVLVKDDANMSKVLEGYRDHFKSQFQLNNHRTKEIMKEKASFGRRFRLKYAKNDRGTTIVPAVPKVVETIDKKETQVDPKFVAIVDWRERQSLTAWTKDIVGHKGEETVVESVPLDNEIPDEIDYMPDVPTYYNDQFEGQEESPLWNEVISEENTRKAEENVVPSQTGKQTSPELDDENDSNVPFCLK